MNNELHLAGKIIASTHVVGMLIAGVIFLGSVFLIWVFITRKSHPISVSPTNKEDEEVAPQRDVKEA